MSNDATRANAEGLPDINRRRLLLGLAAASTAAATVTVAQAATPAENPELIRLAAVLPPLAAEYRRARDHQDETLAKWKPRWPSAPAALICPDLGGPEQTFAGGFDRGRKVLTSDTIRWRLNIAKRALRSRAAVKPWHAYRSREEWEAEFSDAQRLYDIALKYEAKMDRIIAAANYDEAWKAVRLATRALGAHISEIMDQPDLTMAGLLAKAEALAAWGAINSNDHVWVLFKPHRWHASIAASILRHAEGGAA